jgi:alpha-D-ribose 1-methylphosphonate 5-triphosphate synthase subunit PhnG
MRESPAQESWARESTTRESHYDANRRAALAVLAGARVEEIEQHLQAVVEPVDYVELRAVETGLVMLRGRIGGDGAPFNLGEATVTRAAVQITSGEVGFAFVLGRDQKKARLCAVCDALWQSKAYRDAVERCVLAPIRARLEVERADKRAQTAATRVDFLTLVRGED